MAADTGDGIRLQNPHAVPQMQIAYMTGSLRADRALEDPPGTLEDCDFHAQPACRCRDFEADETSPDDDEAASGTDTGGKAFDIRDRAQLENIAAPDKRLRQWTSLRAGGNHQPIPCIGPPARFQFAPCRVDLLDLRSRSQLDPGVAPEGCRSDVEAVEGLRSGKLSLRKRRALVGRVVLVSENQDRVGMAVCAQPERRRGGGLSGSDYHDRFGFHGGQPFN